MGKGGREGGQERKRERDSERERERADTSSITFSSGGYTVMSDESIFGAPPGGGRRSEGAGATRGAGGQGEKGRLGGGCVRRRTCVPDGASLFGDGDHYSIRFHFDLEEKRLDDMPLVGGVGRFFQRTGKVRNSTIFRAAIRTHNARAYVSWKIFYTNQFSRDISLYTVSL